MPRIVASCGFLSFARPEGQVAGIGAVDDVLELLDDRFGAAGDDEAGAKGGVVAPFGHPPLPSHITTVSYTHLTLPTTERV